MRKIAIRSVVFGLCWVAWSAFVILWLAPELASHQLYTHTATIAWILCIVPLVLYAVLAIRWSKPRPKR